MQPCPRSWVALHLTIALCTAFSATAQTFQRTYGGPGLDEGRHVLVLADGGFLVTGRTTSAGPGTESLWTMRTNAVGEPLWSITYGGPFSEVGLRARVHPDGGFLVLGHTDNSWGGLRNLYLLRLADDGSLLWSRSIGSSGNDDASDVLVLPDGGCLLTGNSGAFGGRRVLVARLDTAGELLWVRQVNSTGNDNGLALAPAGDGGFLVVGSTQGLGPGQVDMVAVRYTASGDQLWLRTMGGPEAERALSVVPTTDGGWLIGGNTTSFGSGDQSILLVHLNDSGEVVWSKAYGGDRQDILRSIEPAQGGGYLIGGLLFGTPGQTQDHGLLMHLDEAGAVLWSRTYGAVDGLAELYTVARTPEGYVATGQRANFQGDLDLLLMRTDEEGQSGCDQAEVDMTPIDVVLTVTSPTPTTITTGITSSAPPTQTASGPTPLDTPCLDFGTGLGDGPETPALRPYPNPAQDRLWIDNANPNATLRLVDVRGAVVFEGPVDQGILDVRGLPPGLYTGVLTAPEAVQHLRFVKE